MEGCRSHKIAGVEERVVVEEIEAVVTDHSFSMFGSNKRRKDLS